MEIKVESIQEAIDLAVKEKSNVLMPCVLYDAEIKAAITDSRGCHVFRAPGGMIRIVPPEHLEMWTEMVRLVPGLPVRPDVETDPSLKTGEVYMESSLGRVDLGVRTQLEEVERVFFDGSGPGPGAAEGAAWPEAAGKKG